MTDPETKTPDPLGEQLRALRVDPPESEFRAALHRRLVAAGPPAASGPVDRLRDYLQARPLILGGATGLVAGVAAFALLFGLRTGPEGQTGDALASLATAAAGSGGIVRAIPSGPDASGARLEAKPEAKLEAKKAGRVASAAERLQRFRVPAEKVAVVKLHFTAEQAVEEVDFSIVLPEGLSFWSDGKALAQRSFRWRAPLQAGDNVVPIALKGQHPGRYRIVATAAIGEEVIAHDLVLDVHAAVLKVPGLKGVRELNSTADPEATAG
ncbi:MAG: hypothetical protein MJD61_11790 [Proteobacteria bacterium]|nr:hypothetical protein [Pseudomonadota bacterium]